MFQVHIYIFVTKPDKQKTLSALIQPGRFKKKKHYQQLRPTSDILWVYTRLLVVSYKARPQLPTRNDFSVRKWNGRHGNNICSDAEEQIVWSNEYWMFIISLKQWMLLINSKYTILCQWQNWNLWCCLWKSEIMYANEQRILNDDKF